MNTGQEQVKRYSIKSIDIYPHFLHLVHDGLGAFQDVSVDGGTKGHEFFLGVAILV
jgi:hypothetical protein